MKLVYILDNESFNCDHGIGDEAVIADVGLDIVGRFCSRQRILLSPPENLESTKNMLKVNYVCINSFMEYIDVLWYRRLNME